LHCRELFECNSWQNAANGTVAKSLPQNKVILLNLLISNSYIPYTDLQKNFYRHSHRRNMESGGLHRHRCYHRVFYCPTVRLSLGLVGHVLLCIYHSRIWSCRDGIAFERELICFRWNILDFLRLCRHYMQSVPNTSLVFLVSVSVYCLFPAYVHCTYVYHHP